MARIDTGDAAFNQGRRAEAVLDHILDTELSNEAKEQATYVSVAEELQRHPVLDVQSGRTKSRVLFVTTNESVLEEHSDAQQEYVALAAMFDEVHVMVLIARAGSDGHARIGKRTWTYTVHNKYWWRLPWTAVDTAYDSLTFNQSVRPDIIVATDPFESGMAAYFIARDFGRPLQVHVREDFTTKHWLAQKEQNTWRKRMARYVLKRTLSVRTKTDVIQKKLAGSYQNITDIRTLPQFYNFAGLLDSKPNRDVHDVYKQFSFVIVAFGPLTADSHLHDIFTALRTTLLSNRIGLLIVGTGPAKKLFQEKSEILGIEKNVVFIEHERDVISLLKTADMMIETDTDKEHDRSVLQAAAAGLPTVMYETDLRKDLFKDAESAFLVPAGDVHVLGQKATKLLNSQATRLEFSRNSQAMAKSRLQENPVAYYQAFRDTIEVILVPSEAADSSPLPQDETTDTDTSRRQT